MKTFSLILTVCFMFVAAQALHAVDPAPAAAPAAPAAEKKADDKAAAAAAEKAPAIAKTQSSKKGTVIVMKDGSVKLAVTLYSLELDDATKKQLVEQEGKIVKVMGDLDIMKKTVKVSSFENADAVAADVKPAADKPAEKTTEKTTERTTEKTAEKAADKPAEKAPEKK